MRVTRFAPVSSHSPFGTDPSSDAFGADDKALKIDPE